MQAEQLKSILDAHTLWRRGDSSGKRANLREADLRWSDLSWSNLRGANLSEANLSWADLSEANLRGANLRGADLRWSNLREADLSWSDLSWSNLSWSNLSEANLRGANLSGADLSEANLSGANLSGAEGLFDSAKWISDNLQRTRGGVFAYKTFGANYFPPQEWKIEPRAEISENVNPLPTLNCVCGVNVATLDWCREWGGGRPIWKLLIKWEWLAGGVIPYNTDGKFRVPRAKLIEIVESAGESGGETS